MIVFLGFAAFVEITEFPLHLGKTLVIPFSDIMMPKHSGEHLGKNFLVLRTKNK